MNSDEFMEYEFDSISIVSESLEKNVLIRILNHDKKEIILSAYSVSYFTLDKMTLQNIIENINFYDLSKINENISLVREKIFFLLQGKYPIFGEEGKLKKIIDDIVEDIKLSKAVLLEIKPVYGAYVLLIAKRISINATPE